MSESLYDGDLGLPVRLLLDCLHHDASRADAAILAHLSERHWQALLAVAEAQQISPLLYSRLTERGLAAEVPEPFLQHTRRAYRQCGMRNLQLYAALSRLASALTAVDVPVIALKGAYLAKEVYPDVAQRAVNDIDVMVPRQSVAQAVDTLSGLGYVPEMAQVADVDVHMAQKQHVQPLAKPGSPTVEIHWTIAKPNRSYSIDESELWSRCVPVVLGNVDLLAFSPEDLVLHLCYHAAYQHQFQFGLRPSCDIAMTIERFGGRLDWDSICCRARRWSWTRGVGLSLLLARDLLGAAVPDAVLSDLGAGDIEERVVRSARSQTIAGMEQASHVPATLSKMHSGESMLARAQHMLRTIFLPRARMALKYPVEPDSALVYWYYLVRVRHLVQKHTLMSWKLARGDQDLTEQTHRINALADWLEGPPRL